MPGSDGSGGGLGPQLAGEKISVNNRVVSVVKQLGEGGFSFVYLVKNTEAPAAAQRDNESGSAAASAGGGGASASSEANGSVSRDQLLVLKITSVHSREQRDIAEKEAKLLSRLSHPSIVRMVDSSFRTAPSGGGGGGGHFGIGLGGGGGSNSHGGGGGGWRGRPQHLILMEYCEGGTALSVCNRLRKAGRRFDLPSLIIAFGQICNAVSYLHAQRPPIVHRDLKPGNFLVKNGAYKLCDFGSAVFGHVDLKTQHARSEAEEVILKTTTQMFRAPEMVSLLNAKKLTQSTDVWALGCCLYSLAFFQNCFEEGSNLAILNRAYKIPEDNPYGEGLVELIDRMLKVDSKARADMTEVILCLSAIYSDKPLPPRKRAQKKEKSEAKSEEPVGSYNTTSQGVVANPVEPRKPAMAKPPGKNSVAYKRRINSTTTAARPPLLIDGPLMGQQSQSAQCPPSPTNESQSHASFADLAFRSSKNYDQADPFNPLNTHDSDNEGHDTNPMRNGGSSEGETPHQISFKGDKSLSFDAFKDMDLSSSWNNHNTEEEKQQNISEKSSYYNSFDATAGGVFPAIDKERKKGSFPKLDDVIMMDDGAAADAFDTTTSTTKNEGQVLTANLTGETETKSSRNYSQRHVGGGGGALPPTREQNTTETTLRVTTKKKSSSGGWGSRLTTNPLRKDKNERGGEQRRDF